MTREQRAIELGYIPDKEGNVYNKDKRGYVKGHLINKRAGTLGIKVKDPETNEFFSIYIHRLVWTYHKEPIPEGAYVIHKENKLDNSIENLELIPA